MRCAAVAVVSRRHAHCPHSGPPVRRPHVPDVRRPGPAAAGLTATGLVSTPARKAQLIEELRQLRETLSVTVEALPDAETARPIFRRDRVSSSIRLELIRLADAEVNYRTWIERARSGGHADVSHDPVAAVGLEIEDAESYSVAEIVAAMRDERRQTMALIRDLDPSTFLVRVTNGTVSVSVDDLIGALARHDRDLQDAIRRRDAGYLPRYYVLDRARAFEGG